MCVDCSGEQMSELVMLHSRLMHVRSQWEALQNPAMRAAPQTQENLPPKVNNHTCNVTSEASSPKT